MQKRFVRPENTSYGLSCEALQDELSKLAHEALVLKQQTVSDQLEYASLFSNGATKRTIKFSRCHFWSLTNLYSLLAVIYTTLI